MFAKNEKKGEEVRSTGLNQIDHGTKITGDIESQGNFRIDGTVNGNIVVGAKLFLGKSGKVVGNITAVNAEIEGSVVGDMEIGELLVLKETAKVNGMVTYGKVSVTPGAEIESTSFRIKSGSVKNIKSEPRQAAKTA